MTDRLTEINSEIEALNQELQKQQEYHELFEKVKAGKPDFHEFMKLAVKFVSNYEGDIPLDEGAVQKIKIERWARWTVRFTMKDSYFGDIIYDIDAEKMDISERILKHVSEELSDLRKEITEKQEERVEVEETLGELQDDLSELEAKINNWKTGVE